MDSCAYIIGGIVAGSALIAFHAINGCLAGRI